MSGHGRFVALLIAGCLLMRFEGSFAQDDEAADYDSDYYSDNQIDLSKTYRSGVEKILQGLMKVVSPGTSRSSSDGGGGITGFLTSHLPKPIKNIFNGAEKVASRGFGDVLDLFEDNFHAIFPGTLWCGGGNVSRSEEDVGLFKYTDSCCREHDSCPSSIPAGRTKGSLINDGIFSRSACFCDQQFYHCLKNVSTVISMNIGTTYFNILRPQCFSYEYPIESCAQFSDNRLVHKKCLEYSLDNSRNKTLQWFDNPDF